MTNKERIEKLEKAVQSLLELRELQHERDHYILEALRNTRQLADLNEKRIGWLEKDLLRLQREDHNINDDWRPL
jgi:hypothetical protein